MSTILNKKNRINYVFQSYVYVNQKTLLINKVENNRFNISNKAC